MLTQPASDTELYRLQVRELRNYAMFMLDPEGNILSWNAGVEEILGYRESEWVGQHGSIIFTPADQGMELCLSEMKKAASAGSSTDIRWHRRKDGTELFGNGFLNAVYGDSGELIGFTKVLSDETMRKQLQDSLTESNAALEQFAYVASHDLQEPLRTMTAYAQLLMRRYKGKFDAEADQFLGFIVEAAARMSAQVEAMLSYARATAGEVRPSSVALDEDAEAALSHLSQAIEESGGKVTHEALPVVEADRGQMVRLFQNLVGNGLKYRHPERPPEIHITAELKGSEWMISVRDNGIGFDPAYGDQIFAPFKRLHTDAAYSGTGVGLAICKRIVEMHGGRIWAESKPGEGSVFRFTLPDRPPAKT
jgi:PAS domain S-box-containing protein